MKTGCLFAFLSSVTLFVLALLFGFALDAVLPRPHGANFEGIGRLTGFLFLFLVPSAFIFGYRRQAQREAQKPRIPENSRPYDASRMKGSVQLPQVSNPDDRNA
jgi:hypothetical protein